VGALVDGTYINGAPDNVTIIVADMAESAPAKSAMEFFGTAAL
jgi:hypothetical protein